MNSWSTSSSMERRLAGLVRRCIGISPYPEIRVMDGLSMVMADQAAGGIARAEASALWQAASEMGWRRHVALGRRGLQAA